MQVGELDEMLPRILLQHRLHGVGADAEIGRHHRRHPRRPAGPGVTFLPRQPEHQRDGTGTVDQLAAEFLQPHLALLRLQHLVGGARLQVRHAAGRLRRRQALLAQRLRHRADGLLSGRLSDAEWRAQLRDEGCGPASLVTEPPVERATNNDPTEAYIMPNAGPLAVTAEDTDAADPLAIPEHLRRELTEGPAEESAQLVIPKRNGESKPRQQREGSRQALVIGMLRRPEGATIAQIMAATGWLAHTVRGAFAGALKKKLGLTVTSERADGGDRVYRLAE